MRLRLLGTTTFESEPVRLGSRDRRLLALLAVHAPNAVSPAVIVDELWGEDLPTNPANAVQASVSRLRRKLGDVIPLSDAGYRLEIEPDEIDLAVLEHLVRSARSAETPDERLTDAEVAVELIRAGLEDVPPTVERRFATLASEAHELYAEALLEAHRFTDAARLLEDLVSVDPFREPLWGLLMQALYGDGKQAEALRTFQRAVAALAEAGLEPGPQLSEIEERILLQDPSLSTTPTPLPKQLLPLPRTQTIGRAEDVRSVERLLRSSRTVTLTGLGGVGKTTLATEVGRARADRAWFVDLTSISRDDDVSVAVAEAVAPSSIDRAPLDRIVDRFIGTAGLLIIDNCEHVIEGAAATVSALIDRLPDLHVLATSREPLRIRGEQTYPVSPLDTGIDGAAVELFSIRAEAVRPGVTDGVDHQTIVDVCRRVDGIPLAIELVASAAATMSVDDLAARLGSEQPLPTSPERDRPARHASLEAIVEWSVSNLSEDERRVFARLSVLPDGGRLDAVERVVGFEPVEPERVGLMLAELVNRSLVDFDAGRYRQLWLVRRIAARGLKPEESEELERRFVQWSADLVRSISGQLKSGVEQREALASIDTEAANLRHALRTPAGEESDVIDIAHALVWSSAMRVGNDDSIRVAEERLRSIEGPYTERYVEARLGIALSDAVGERRSSHPSDGLVEMAESVGSPRLIALALGIEALRRAEDIGEAVSMVYDAQSMSDDRWLDGVLHIIEANLVGYVDGVGSATAAAEAAVQDLDAVNDRWRTATALSILGTLRQMSGDYEAADRTHRQVLAIADEMGLDYDRFLALAQIANTALLRGDHAGAIELAHQALAAARALGGGARANALNTLGRVSNAMGRFADARSAHAEALRLYTRLDAYGGMAHSLDNLGLVASRSGDPDEGGRRHLQALEINAEKGDPLSVAFSLEGLALSLAMRDRGDDAARLLGAARAQRAALGLPLPEGERRYVDMAEALARESADDFGAALSDGETTDWRVLAEEVR